MNGVRRALTLLTLTLSVVIGGSVTASADFSGAASVAPSVGTGRVAAPAAIAIEGRCQGWWYEADISWPASTTARGVTGYRVIAHLATGESTVVTETDAAGRTVSVTADRGYLAYEPRISILTLTSYGWTAESARSAVLAC